MSEQRRKPARQPARRSSQRPARGGASSRQPRGRQPKGGASKAIVAGVLTLVVILGAAFALGVFGGGDKPTEDQGTKNTAQKETGNTTAAPKKSGSSMFDAAAVTTEEASTQETAQRERVTNRAPKTVNLKKITKYLGMLYIDEQLEKDILALQKEVEHFKRERWDISKELRAQYRKLLDRVARAKGHPFLSAAQDDLTAFNNFTRRREVHLKDDEGNLLPEPFIGIAHQPFVFMVQAHKSGGEKAIADEVYDWMVQLKAEFERYFEGTLELKPSTRHNRIRIVLFRTYKDYANYNRIKNPERDISFTLAHYEPQNRRLCVPLDFGAMGGGKDKKHSFREVMFHEGTHQVMHYFTNKSHLGAWGAMWSDEGVAEYFAGHAIEDGKIKFGRVNSRIASVAADRKSNDSRISMEQLLTWTRFKMEKERKKGPEKERAAQRIHSHVYSQGWALVYFFNHYRNGKYKAKFLQIMKQQIEEGRSGLGVCREIFTDEGFEQMENEYFEYLDFLTAAYVNKKIKNHTLVE